MEKPVITAIVLGALLLALGMIPDLLAALMEGLRNFPDHVSQTRGPIFRFQADLRFSGDIWLVVGGGVMMVLGLVAGLGLIAPVIH